MRTLLRNAPTGLYVQSPDSWTSNPAEACDFGSMSEAIRYVEGAGLRRMQLAFVSGNLCRLTEVPLEQLRWGASISRRLRQAA